MANYIIRINDDPCGLNFGGTVMPALKSWNFTPYSNSGATMTHLENTYQGANKNFLLAKGTNITNENGDLNGTLELKFQCLDMLKNRSFNRLSGIQIEGFPLGLGVGKQINLPAQYVTNLNSRNIIYNVPIGKKIKIQLIGGFGNVRYANTSDSSIARINKNVAFEVFNYQPQLKNLNNSTKQIDGGEIIVDRNLGEGEHIFEIEAFGLGEAHILFRDMAGSIDINSFNSLFS